VVVANIFLGDIFRGSLPFIGIQLLALMLILFFPELKVLFR
jgi:TRAP-type mannitol/chloroaromatic compound transport system permease large subunit